MGRGLSVVGWKRDCVEDRSGLEKFRAEVNVVARGGSEGGDRIGRWGRRRRGRGMFL